jgi:hypothetical protein
MYKFQLRELMLALSATGAVIMSADNADCFVEYCQSNHVKCYVSQQDGNVVEIRKGVKPMVEKAKVMERRKTMKQETRDFFARWDENIRLLHADDDDVPPIIA